MLALLHDFRVAPAFAADVLSTVLEANDASASYNKKEIRKS